MGLDSDLTIHAAAALIVIDQGSHSPAIDQLEDAVPAGDDFEVIQVVLIVFFNSAASPKEPIAPGFSDAGT